MTEGVILKMLLTVITQLCTPSPADAFLKFITPPLMLFYWGIYAMLHCSYHWCREENVFVNSVFGPCCMRYIQGKTTKK